MWGIVLFIYSLAWTYQIVKYYQLYRTWINYQPSPAIAAAEPPVSVIVCAHNELSNLKDLLPLLYRQQYSAFEIVVVEDTSNDDSLDFLLAQKERYPTLKIVWLRDRAEHVGGKKYALTLGIRAARYSHLLLTDADCRPKSPYWICQMMKVWESQYEFVLGYSPYQSKSGLLNLFIRYETLHTAMMYMGSALRGRPYMGVGRNLAYRKLFFLDKGGFRGFWRVTGGDDDLFVNRYATAENTTIVTSADSQVYSVPKDSWRSYFRQKLRHLSVGKHYKKTDQQWLGSFSLASILVWIGWFLSLLYGNWLWVTVSLLLRWVLMGLTLRSAGDRLDDSFPLHMLPIFDFLFVIYYISIGPAALLSKYIRWK